MLAILIQCEQKIQHICLLKLWFWSVYQLSFASSVLAAPRTIISFMAQNNTTKTIDSILNYQEPVGFCLYLVMIVLFAFFYSNLQIDSHKISEDLKKNGGAYSWCKNWVRY